MPPGSVKHSVASNTGPRAPSIFIQCFSFFRLMPLRFFGGYFAGVMFKVVPDGPLIGHLKEAIVSEKHQRGKERKRKERKGKEN